MELQVQEQKLAVQKKFKLSFNDFFEIALNWKLLELERPPTFLFNK